MMLNQLHIVPDIAISSGGLGLAALRFAESVSQAGARVILLTASHGTETLLESAIINSTQFKLAHVPYCSFQLQYLLKQYQSIEELCTRNDFDLFHFHGVWHPLFFVAAGIAQKRKIPFVVSPHGCFEPWALNYKHLKKSLALMTYQGIVNRAATMFFATAGQEVESIRRLGVSQPIVTIPNGVDLANLPFRAPVTGKRTVLFLSRIHPKKGLINLVEAWVKVRNENWRIMIAGSDEDGHQAEVQALISAYGLESDFEFVGLVSGLKKTECFTNAELFVLPTYSENFGLVVAEALANELPVITTTGAPWKDIEDYRCGWWVPPSVIGISEALKIAMNTDPNELRLMGKRGRKLVSEKYSWDKIGRDALLAYKSMFTSEPTPTPLS